ncbi:MAG TPA: hypothetical protein VKH34_09075 [Vicinamibacterales bacterium]|nr:hypothetical protein [Vicinamibacterales bacterium]
MIAMPIAAAFLMLQTAAAPKAATPKAAAAATVTKTDVGVTVAYKGKGAVDAGHKIIVFAFSDPNITSGSRPIGPAKFVAKNGDTVTFENVTTPIYIFAVYDEKGTYDGVSGPPPAGIPATAYRKTPKGAPTAVAAGSPAVKFTFDDTERWSK